MKGCQRLLFVCSRNQWRSPTAEALWKNDAFYQARSAGTSDKARKTISPQDVRWADVIFVMENKHKKRLLAKFGDLLAVKPIYVLDIPDEYKYMDDALVEELQDKVNSILRKLNC